jgi:quercetin dioxygenase-like cupin family protein
MEIVRNGTQPSVKGPGEWCTGSVRIAGDVVWCPPGHRHWHGATPTTAMTHIAVQESLDGSPVSWMEQVSDADYLKGTADAEH